MSIFEKLIYTAITFTGVYMILWLTLELFEITSSPTAHLIAGFASIAVSVLLFMYLLIIKKETD